MPKSFINTTSTISICIGLFASVAAAFEGQVSPQVMERSDAYSPFAGRAYPDQVLFGDLHFHTEISFDAGLIGTSLDMHDAFRVARGEKITSNTGQPVQLIRPLDFLAITEHAELIGLATAVRGADPRLLADDWGRQTYERFNSGQEGRMAAFADIIEISTIQMRDPTAGLGLDGDIWNDIIETVDHYNEPGVFTSLAGFEWTSTPIGDNLHRVVIFEDGADLTSQTRPSPISKAWTPKGSGIIWRPTKTTPADGLSRFPTTETCQTA